MEKEYAFSKRARKLIGQRSKEALRKKMDCGERVSDIPPYGWQYVGQKMIEHSGEQAVIQRIIGWRADGLGSRTICRKLMALGIPSRGGIKWYHASVLKILRRAGVK